MKTTILFFPMFLLILMSCGDDDSDEINVDNRFLLAGEVSKDWKLSAESTDATETVESCKSSSERSQDNTYTFFANGAMEWDHGQITEGTEEFGCSDFRNLVGDWRFIEQDSKIVWTFKYDRDDPSIVINATDTITVDVLEENRFVVSGEDKSWAEFVPRK